MISKMIAEVLRNEEHSLTVISVVAGLVGAVTVLATWWLWH